MSASAAANSNTFELVPQAARILVVDDEPRQRSSLAELVALRGYRVDTAINGIEAMQQLGEHPFSLVLLDIRMPSMDGHQVLRRIREQNIDVAVIALSGDPTTEDATAALKAGADDYLRKPYAPEQIYSAIENSLSKRALATENQKMRRRLEQSERLHRLIVNHSPDLMLLLDTRRCIRFVNQAADFVLGYRPEELLGKPFETLLDVTDHVRARELLELDPEQPELRTAELALRPRRVDISARTFELLAMPLAFHGVSTTFPGVGETAHSDPKASGAYIVARDISDRLRSERLMLENEQRFRDFAELGSDWLWETDRQGRFARLSDSFERCFTTPPGGLLGQQLLSALSALVGDHPALLKVREAVTEQSPFEVEFDDLGPQHAASSMVLFARPVFDRDGEFCGYRGIGRDVSEARRQRRELVSYRERLESLVRQRTHDLDVINRELESFSSSVSHDLRTPLRAITGFSSVLLDEYQDRLDHRGKGHLQRIVRATARMSNLIDELLGLSRVTRQSINREQLDLGELGVQVDRTLRDQEPGRKVVFEAARPLIVQADRKLLRIALHNLLENAWKYTRVRESALITLNQERIDGFRVFVVSDNGVGFDPRHAGKLFGPFERLHNDPQYEGNGIGLATVARIIHRHGGRVWADAELDRGARIYFTLPDQEQAMALAGRDPFRAVSSATTDSPDS